MKTGTPMRISSRTIDYSKCAVQPGDGFSLAKWRPEIAVQNIEWRGKCHRGYQVLLRAFDIHKEEELVCDEGAAEAPAKLVALERNAGTNFGGGAVIAE